MKSILILRMTVVVLILSLFYIPLMHMVSKAFLFEGKISLYWFHALFEDPSFWSAFVSSFWIAMVSSSLSVLLALWAVLDEKRRSKKLDHLMALALSFPEIVLSLSLLSLFVLLKIPLGETTIIFGHTTLTISFSYFILSLQMKKLDPSILEAAADLGASSADIRKQIKIPWLKTSLMASFSLCFLLSIDDFLISFFLSGAGQDTLPIKLFSMLKIGISPKINALSFLILLFSGLTLLILFPFMKNLRKKDS